jgi:phosphoribosylanthranilate isomerase
MKSPTELPFVIKVCGITNEDDARIAVDAGANALGFNFYQKSPRCGTVARARAIAEAVKGEYLVVGVFVNPTADEVLAAVEDVRLDVVQLHGNRCPQLSSQRVWKAVAPGENGTSYPGAEAYLIDTPSETFGGSGKIFDWRLASRRPYRVLIAGGLDASNVAEAIAAALPWGVDACSRLESHPGKKAAQKVKDFVRAARQAMSTQMEQEISL